MNIDNRTRSRSRSLIEKWEGWTTNRRKRSSKQDETMKIDDIYLGKVTGLIPQWNNLLAGMNGRIISFRQYQDLVASGKISFRKYQEQYPLVNRSSLSLSRSSLTRFSFSNKSKNKDKIIWKELMSAEGYYYYWNTETNDTQYEKPTIPYKPYQNSMENEIF